MQRFLRKLLNFKEKRESPKPLDLHIQTMKQKVVSYLGKSHKDLAHNLELVEQVVRLASHHGYAWSGGFVTGITFTKNYGQLESNVILGIVDWPEKFYLCSHMDEVGCCSHCHKACGERDTLLNQDELLDAFRQKLVSADAALLSTSTL